MGLIQCQNCPKTSKPADKKEKLFTTSQPQCQDSFWNLDPTVRLLRNRPNAFYNFTMGNRPKMSLKYAIFKICPKLARKWYSCETRVYSTIFGDSWRQKVVSVFWFGHPKSHFFAPENDHFQWFWVQKNGTLDAQIQKQRPLFVVNYPQIWWNRLLFHMNQRLQPPIFSSEILSKIWVNSCISE